MCIVYSASSTLCTRFNKPTTGRRTGLPDEKAAMVKTLFPEVAFMDLFQVGPTTNTKIPACRANQDARRIRSQQ